MRHIGRRLFRRLRGVAYGDSSTATSTSPDAGVGQATLVARPTRRRRVSIILPFVAAALLAVAAFGSNELPSLHPRVEDASASLYSTTYTFGTENSWVRVQNIGGSPASVTVSYYNEAGQLLGQDGCPSGSCGAIGPGQGWTFFQSQQPQLPFGYRGSAVVESDQPIVALHSLTQAFRDSIDESLLGIFDFLFWIFD